MKSATQSPFFHLILSALRRKCPNCRNSSAFKGYLNIRHSCQSCQHPLSQYACDDGPAYFTILIVGHLIVSGVLFCEQVFSPPFWFQIALWTPLVIILCMLILPVMKSIMLTILWWSEQKNKP